MGSAGGLWEGPLIVPPNGDLLSHDRLNQKTNYIGSGDPSVTFAGILYYNTSTDTLEIRKADNASWFIGLNQSLKTTDSPTLAGLTLNNAGACVPLIETTGDYDVGLEIQRNKTVGSYNETWYMHIPTSSKILQWDLDGSTFLMQLSTSGTLTLAGGLIVGGSLYVNGGSFGLEVNSNIEVSFQFGRTGLSYPIIWTEFIDVSSTILKWYQSTTSSTVMSLDPSGNLVIVGGLTIGSLAGVLKATAGVVAGSATLDDIGEGTTYKRVTATIYGYLSNANAQLASLYTTTAPTFSGVTLGALAGVLKASAGVVGGSATLDDIGEGTTYKRVTATIYGYLSNANAQLSALYTTGSPTFAGLSISANNPELSFVSTVHGEMDCIFMQRNESGGSYNVNWHNYIAASDTKMRWYANNADKMTLDTGGNLVLGGTLTTTQVITSDDIYSRALVLGRYSAAVPWSYIRPSSGSSGIVWNNAAVTAEIMSLDNSGSLVVGGVLQAAGYKSSDGTAGETFSAVTCKTLTVKNGLVVAHTT